MPSCIHHTFSAARPWMPVEANGAPLSVRMASGKPTARNERAEDRLRVDRLHGAQAVAREQAAAEVIGHGERIAVVPVAGPELALEVGGPHLIGLLRRTGAAPGCAHRCRRRFLRSRPWRSRIALTGAARRPRAPRVPRPQHLQELLGAPAVLLSRCDDQRFQCVARAMRTPSAARGCGRPAPAPPPA